MNQNCVITIICRGCRELWLFIGCSCLCCWGCSCFCCWGCSCFALFFAVAVSMAAAAGEVDSTGFMSFLALCDSHLWFKHVVSIGSCFYAGFRKFPFINLSLVPPLLDGFSLLNCLAGTIVTPYVRSMRLFVEKCFRSQVPASQSHNSVSPWVPGFPASAFNLDHLVTVNRDIELWV